MAYRVAIEEIFKIIEEQIRLAKGNQNTINLLQEANTKLIRYTQSEDQENLTEAALRLYKIGQDNIIRDRIKIPNFEKYILNTKEEEKQPERDKLKQKSNSIASRKTTNEKSGDFTDLWIRKTVLQRKLTDKLHKIAMQLMECLKETNPVIYSSDDPDVYYIVDITTVQLRIIMRSECNRDKEWNKFLFDIPQIFGIITGQIVPHVDDDHVRMLKDMINDFDEYYKSQLNIKNMVRKKVIYRGYIIKRCLTIIAQIFNKESEYAMFIENINDQGKETMKKNNIVWDQFVATGHLIKYHQQVYIPDHTVRIPEPISDEEDVLLEDEYHSDDDRYDE